MHTKVDHHTIIDLDSANHLLWQILNARFPVARQELASPADLLVPARNQPLKGTDNNEPSHAHAPPLQGTDNNKPTKNPPNPGVRAATNTNHHTTNTMNNQLGWLYGKQKTPLRSSCVVHGITQRTQQHNLKMSHHNPTKIPLMEACARPS